MIKALILAGGRGSRLGPLTEAVPKPMIAIRGRPLLYYIVGLLKRRGINEVVFCVGYLKEVIIDYFGDGSQFGVEIEYSVENDFLGTGGALRMAKDLLTEDFILLYGDSYLAINYSKLVETWFQSKAKGLVVCYDNQEKIAQNNIFLDSSGCINGYNKRMPDKRMNYLEAGVMLFKKEILGYIPSGRVVSLEEDIFPVLIQEKCLVGYPTSQRFYDIGTPKGLKEIKEALI